jgi:hypothetical protein
MSDIVERLRDPSSGSPRWLDTMNEAADEIEKLRTEVERLKAVQSESTSNYLVGYKDDGFGGSPMQYDYYGRK